MLDALRSPGDPTRITMRDRRLAKETRRELQQVLDRLFSTQEITITDERTVRITRSGGNSPTGGRGDSPTGKPKPAKSGKTEPFEQKTVVPELPDVVVDAWDAPVRAETRRLSNGRIAIAVNKSHPSYAASNARYAIAESVILEALRTAGGLSGIDEFLSEADMVLAEWASRIAEEEDE